MWDLRLGRDFLSHHEFVSFNFGGPESPLHVGALQPIKNVPTVRLFEHMNPDCRPIAAPSGKYSKADQEFIELSIC